MFISTSTGFDFYSHAVTYYFHDKIIYHTDLLFGEIVLPRYWLLSYLYEFSSRIGIPAGYLSLALLIFPVYKLVSDTNYAVDAKGQTSYSLVEFFSFLFLLILCFFYSGASLVVLWFLALLKTKNPIFLIGGLLHPIGILLFGVGTILINKKLFIKFIFVLLVAFCFFYVCTKASLFTSSTIKNARFLIEFGNILSLFEYAIDKKSNEIFSASFIAILFFLSKGVLLKKINIFQKIRISKLNSNIIMFFFVIFIIFTMINKNTLIKSIRTADIHVVIYIAWFDWGKKDYDDEETPWSLNYKRYVY